MMVKPPNKGHIGDRPVVPCREVVVFNIINLLSQQNDVKSVLLSDNVVDCKLKIHGEGIMSHNFPCSPQGGKLSQ